MRHSALVYPYSSFSREADFLMLEVREKKWLLRLQKGPLSTKSQSVPFGSCLFNLTHFRHNPALDANPPSLALLSLSFGLCDPLSPGLERPSLPILDNCESLLIGLQRKRITWAHNDVMARGPSPPPPLPSLLLTSPPLKPNPHQPQMSLKPPA